MGAWPGQQQTQIGFHLPSLHTFSLESVGGEVGLFSGAAQLASTTWPTANKAIYVPLRIRYPYLVKQVWWANGAATLAGTVSVGVYTLGGQQLILGANTTASGASTVQAVTVTNYLLLPDVYYLALSCSSASGHFMALTSTVTVLAAVGCAEQVTANPLPATATFATMVNTVYPLFGITDAALI